MSTVVLGLDPGFANCGWALVRLTERDECVISLGVVTTEKSDKKRAVLASADDTRRSRELHRGLHPLVRQALILASEAWSPMRNASSAAKVARAFTVRDCLAEQYGRSIVEASPQAIKAAVAGKKTATKDDVEASLLARYPGIDAHLRGVKRSLHEHAYDALGAVVACLDSEIVRLARSMAA